MVRFIKKIRNFQFKGILMILGCFILIAAVLFAERSGVQYQEKKRQISYIDKDKIITEKEAADSLKRHVWFCVTAARKRVNKPG